MLENNTFRLLMAIGAIIVCALIINLFISNYGEIKDVVDSIMARRIIQY